MGKSDFCCAPNCSNRRTKKGKIQFYRIPKNNRLRKIWLHRIRRKNFKPTANTRLCSEHFVGGRKSLDPENVSYLPSVFSYNKSVTRRNSRNSQRATLDDHEPTDHKPKAKRKPRKECAHSGRTPEAKFDIESTIWAQCLPESSGLKAHDYLRLQADSISQQFAQSHPAEFNELKELHAKIKELEEENYRLKDRCISLEQIQQKPDLCQFWTGFPNYGTFKALFDYLEEAAKLKTNWRGQATVKGRLYFEGYTSKPGPSPKISLEDEFLMTMMRLKGGLALKDLSHRFGLSVASVSKIFTTWINLMYFELKNLCQMQEWDKTETAKQFSQFPHLRVILDCTEIFCEKPSSLQANKEVYSNYKSHTTFKYLVGISPHPAVVYVSKAWGGRASDKTITQTSSDLIDALQPNDEVMVDRGFQIEGILSPLGVTLTIPDFKGQGRAQLTESEGKRSEKIAEARIHVERAMQRIKCFHILDRELRLTMASLADQIFTVCAYLVNFQHHFSSSNNESQYVMGCLHSIPFKVLTRPILKWGRTLTLFSNILYQLMGIY